MSEKATFNYSELFLLPVSTLQPTFEVRISNKMELKPIKIY